MRSRLFPAFVLLALAALGASAADAPPAENPLWLRYPAVSPDGSAIAFTYGGRIWRVPAAGGVASPLSEEGVYSTHPVWSPDGNWIAYASKQHGNLDVYLTPSEGGRTTRLTHHSSDDRPFAFSPDGQNIYFASSRLGSPNSILAGTYAGSDQLYSISTLGGTRRLVIPTPALNVSVDASGNRLLYENRPIYENEWRKGAVSDGAHDIWLYDVAQKSHRQLTDFRGEDRNPVWAPDGRSYYFLSERGGSSNIWKSAATPGAKAVPVTHHRGAAVRFPSVARDGSLVYGLEGEIWRLAPGATRAEKVPIRLRVVPKTQDPIKTDANEYVTEMALSPDGKQVAVVARGEIFVLSTETGATRRLTHTPGHERNVSFAPDGRSLVYVAERDGDMDIYEATLGDPAMQTFNAEGPVNERRLVDTDGDVLQPRISPDGRKLAYLANRNSIRVLDRATGETVTALAPGFIYSYEDGDTSFAWSPDSRWLTATIGSIATSQDIMLLDASGKRAPLQITHSGYSDMDPKFSADGKAVLWASGREGLQQADSGTGQLDIYMAYLTRAGFDGKAEVAGANWQPQEAGLAQRTKRLTPFSLHPVAYALAPGDENLFVIDLAGGGKAVGRRFKVANGEMTELFKQDTADLYLFAPDAASVYALAGGKVNRIDLATGESRAYPLATPLEVDARGEMGYFFQHFWRLTKLKFYEPAMHGVDWDAVRARYVRYLPHLDTWEDFAEMMSEMAGELNASHMGCFYLKPAAISDHTASLGLYFDETFPGPGVRITAVLPGGPADVPGSRLVPGAVILAVDAEMVAADTNFDQLLNGMADTAVQLRIRPVDGKANVTETLVPITLEEAKKLSYLRWVQERKDLVAKLSGGRIGYLHIPAMELENYKQAYSEVIGDYRKQEALVIDVRYNLGGNLHDQLITLFTGEAVAGFVSRDSELVGRIPVGRWARPTALVQNAAAYSDGSVFPHLYKRLKLGPIIGDRVPGTGTAVWWMMPMKGALKWGIPQLGARDFKTGWLENQEIVPDVPVTNDPAAIAAGRDPQLEAAVATLLKKLPRR